MKLTVKRLHESVGIFTKFDVYADDKKLGTLKPNASFTLDIERPYKITFKRNATIIYYLESSEIPVYQDYNELTIIPMMITGKVVFHYVIRSIVMSEDKLIGIYNDKEKIY